MTYKNAKITLIACTESKTTATDFSNAHEAYKAAAERWDSLTAAQKAAFQHFALAIDPTVFDGGSVYADLLLKDWAKDDGYKSSRVINRGGCDIGYALAVELMDDEIREDLADKLAPCTEQEFFAAYEAAHEAKFGEEWELSKENPAY